MKRIQTGITGFDSLIEGGLPEGTTTLLTGPTGSGKTLFGIQYLFNGAMEYDAPGIYVSLETRPDDLRLEASQFGWDIANLEKQKKFTIIDAASSKAQLPTSEKYALLRGFDMDTLAEMIYEVIKSTNAKRLVLDSIPGLMLRFNETSEVRRELYRISSLLNELKVTSLFIGEIATSEPKVGVEMFVTQGLIMLDIVERSGILERSLLIRKMRFTKHTLKRHLFKIGKSGIKVQKATASK
jgi:KaiC/GvpD/RAD55 family RecA-like ATPase